MTPGRLPRDLRSRAGRRRNTGGGAVYYTIQIAAMPLWLSGLLVVVLPTLLFAIGPLVVRRLVAFERLVVNNEVAGFKFAVLGVIYAVILGLAVIAVWEKFAEADAAATEEAGALAAMYRLTDSLGSAAEEPLRDALSRYARSVIDDDWPAMALAGESEKTRRVLDDVYAATLALPAADARGAVLLQDMLARLDIITDARRDRVTLSAGVVPGVIWLVLIIGAVMTLGFTFFFGLDNLRAQMLMTGMLAVVIFLALFTAIAIDHPFTGSVRAAPEPIEMVLGDFASPGE